MNKSVLRYKAFVVAKERERWRRRMNREREFSEAMEAVSLFGL